jgi:glycosyltransferase involved in cell wall biosynthesis
VRAISVVVPVADEEALLPACLDALAAARAQLAEQRREVASRIVLVLDRCTDGSEAIARSRDAGGAHLAVVTSLARCVGAARAQGSAEAVAGFGAGADHWIATTDADSRVPIDWLTGMVARADAGADIVLGTVRPDGSLPAATAHAYHSAYHYVEGHPHVHGANLGVRASILIRLGGWPQLPTGEDQALVAAAVAAGDVPICRTAKLPVETSTRLAARAPHGFSSHLHGLHADPSAAGPRLLRIH